MHIHRHADLLSWGACAASRKLGRDLEDLSEVKIQLLSERGHFFNRSHIASGG